jgi:hypothetical protein
MPTWLKIVLLVIAANVLAVGFLVAGLLWWVDASTERDVKDSIEAGKAGASFGATHAQSDCIDEGLRQVETCGSLDFRCEAKANMRLFACISVARDDGTCKKVPADITKAEAWANAECARRGRSGSWGCERLLSEVSPACFPP